MNSYQIRISEQIRTFGWQIQKANFQNDSAVFFPQLGVVSKFRSIQWFQVSFSLCSHSHVLVAWLPRFDTRYLPKFHHSNAEKIRGFGRSNPFLATEKSPFFVGLIHLESDTVNDD